MPDRIVRSNILTSDPVNSLSWAGEVFYRRLMSVVDDFGRYDARPSLLRADLYALKLDKVSESDVVKWMNECSKTGLIRFYEVEGKKYLEVQKFGQRLRAMKSKYPEPLTSADICCQMTAIDGHLPPEEKRNEVETETEGTTAQPPPQPTKDEIDFKHVQEWILQNAPTVAKMKEPLKMDQFLKIKDRFPDSAFVGKIFLAMHNWKKLRERQSAYLTFLSFAEKDQMKVA